MAGPAGSSDLAKKVLSVCLVGLLVTFALAAATQDYILTTLFGAFIFATPVAVVFYFVSKRTGSQ